MEKEICVKIKKYVTQEVEEHQKALDSVAMYEFTNVSKEHAASIFSVQDRAVSVKGDGLIGKRLSALVRRPPV